MGWKSVDVVYMCWKWNNKNVGGIEYFIQDIRATQCNKVLAHLCSLCKLLVLTHGVGLCPPAGFLVKFSPQLLSYISGILGWSKMLVHKINKHTLLERDLAIKLTRARRQSVKMITVSHRTLTCTVKRWATNTTGNRILSMYPHAGNDCYQMK